MPPRLHPFDFTFASVADRWFPEIRAAITSRGEALDLPRFSKLAPVQAILADLEPTGENPEASEATEEYVRLLYAAFHFSECGRRTAAVSREVLEEQIPRTAEAMPRATALQLDGAAYFQLPEHRFWSQVGPDEPHEPMDGFFLVSGGADGGEWLIVAILGLRNGRDGFSQISVTATTRDLDSAIPAGRPPLAPAMPGGEVAGFHSVTSVAEMLVLARLALVSTAQ